MASVRDDIVLWGAVSAAVLGFVALINRFFRSIRRVARMADIFLGYDGKPGMADRVTKLEERVGYLTRLVIILAAAQGIDAEKADVLNLLEKLENEHAAKRGNDGT